MHNRIVALLCLAIVVALAPALAYPAAAASSRPIRERVGVSGNALAGKPGYQSIPAFPRLVGERAGVRGNAPAGRPDYLSIPAAAFTPKSQSSDYENHGRYIKAFGNAATFRAPVYLPDGAHLDSLSACFFDDSSASSGTVKMYATLLEDSSTLYEMASTVSTTSSDFQLITDDSIFLVTVNNYSYAYWLELTLPASSDASHGVWGCGVTIAYTHPSTEYGMLSIPGAAFDHPFENGYNAGQTQSGSKLVHFDDGAGSSGTYLAQINLPNGATLNKMTMYYQDTNSSRGIYLALERTNHTGTNMDLATITSVDDLHKTEVTSFADPVVDNDFFTYWAYIQIFPTNLSLWALTIEYTIPAPRIGLLSLSAAAFTPFYDGYDYQNHGRWLFHQYSEAGGSFDGTYLAPVSFPQGATIGAISVIYYDGALGKNGNAVLARSKLGSYEPLAAAPSSSNPGYQTVNQTSIAENTVDNTQYSYFVFFTLPFTSVHNPPIAGDVVGCRITILYRANTFAYLPTVRK